MVRDPEPTLRLNAVWAIKNLLYLAGPETKTLVMDRLTYRTLSEYAALLPRRTLMCIGWLRMQSCPYRPKP